MFRIGGSTGSGITSGLAPKRGRVDGPGGYAGDDIFGQKIGDVLGGDMTLGQLRELSKQMSYKPRGTNVSDFLTEFGLNIASATPQGNIISTAAAAAKEPYSKFLTRKGEAEASQYVSESDMFKTLIKAGATAHGDTGLAGKTEQWKHEKVPEYMSTIMEMEKIDVDERSDEQQLALDSARFNLERMRKDNPFINFFLDNKKLAEALVKKIKAKLIMNDEQSATPIYDPALGEDDPQLIIDTFLEFKNEVKKMASMAKGGRVGFVGGGASGVVSTGGYDTTGRPAYDMEGGFQPRHIPGMPDELSEISYDELRARLPREVSNEVVRLLANSAEALEDFAVIQTEQDIANFNKKYGVNLVLPAEA
jgi:hypothetical protein